MIISKFPIWMLIKIYMLLAKANKNKKKHDELWIKQNKISVTEVEAFLKCTWHYDSVVRNNATHLLLNIV